VTLLEAKTGQRLLLYVGDDFEARYHVRSRLERPVWAHRFLRRPTGQWTVWQVQGFAHVHGIHGKVDLDVIRTGTVGAPPTRRRARDPRPHPPVGPSVHMALIRRTGRIRAK